MAIASLYPSINPSLLLDFANTKQLDPRITFTRTTTATYYDGVTTAVAEQNLLTYSQAFDNAAWTKTSATATANSDTAPDGTSTADTIAASGANGTALQSFTAVAGDYTFSVYLKRKTGTGNIQIAADNGTYTTKTITSSWARYDVTQTLTAGSKSAGIRIVTSGDEVYAWGAQLEQRSSATAYTATTTQAITNYIPVLQTAGAGVARFDHNPTTGESLGLLIEEARTNLCLYSAQLDNAWWEKSNVTITANANVSPDGSLTADLVTSTSANGSLLSSAITVSASTAYTYSIFVKAGNATSITFRLSDGITGQAQVIANLLTGATTVTDAGVYGSVTASSVQCGNGWWRFTVTGTQPSGQTNAYVGFYVGNNDTVFIWGAQLEAGSFATSYIPTTTASATRNADAASMTGTNFSSWFNYGEMTIYAEATGYEAGSYDIIDLDSGSNTGRIRTRFASDYQVNQLDASVAQTFSLDGGSVTAKSFAKIAAGLTQNSQALSLNGGSVATATAPFTTQPAPTTARIGSNFAGSNYLNGTIKKIAFYPVKATNAQLQSLTV